MSKSLQRNGSDNRRCDLPPSFSVRAAYLEGMCNDYEQQIRWAEYYRMMQALELGIPTVQSDADLPQADHIRIGDIGPVMRASDNLGELAPMRFGFPPPRPKASPVFNFRSEGRRFHESKRCLIPASAFFEFTGKKYPKAMHRFSLVDAPFLAIAGLWREGKAGEPPAFIMLTIEPGPDVAPYHDRQVVVLPPSDWIAWLYLTKPEGELLRQLSCGRVDGGDGSSGQRLWAVGPRRRPSKICIPLDDPLPRPK
jgi:putative SOS response-associated peptidase YedK